MSVLPSDSGQWSIFSPATNHIIYHVLGKVPTVGKLLSLNREQIVVETKGSAGTTWCHFPFVEFSVVAESQPKL